MSDPQPNRLDLTAAPPGHKISVTLEKDETQAEQKLRLIKEGVVFFLAILFVLAIGSICVHTLYADGSSEDAKKWAMSVLTAATGGVLGYLLKK